MSVDVLQEKIRKMKNPSVLELAMLLCDLPPQFRFIHPRTFCRSGQAEGEDAPRYRWHDLRA